MFKNMIKRLAVVAVAVLGISTTMHVSAAYAVDVRYLMFSHSDKCLEIPGWSTENSVQADQWDCVNQANAQWVLHEIGESGGHTLFYIVNRHSNLCLDVQGKSTSNGARIIQYGCKGGANQKWYFNSNGHGWVYIVSALSGKCINISGASQANGAKAVQWTCGANGENDLVWPGIPQ